MEVAHLYPDIFQIIRQTLGHLLGKCRNEYTFTLFRSFIDFPYQVIHLSFRLMKLYDGIEKACRPDYLLRRYASALLPLVRRRSSADV